jgi:hypothetical protein
MTDTPLTDMTNIAWDQQLATPDGAVRLATALGITYSHGMVARAADSYWVMLWHSYCDPEVLFWEGCEVHYHQDVRCIAPGRSVKKSTG